MGEHLERAVAISSLVSGGAFLSGRDLGGGGEWLLLGEEVVHQDSVHLLGGLSPGEGGKAEWGPAIGKPLGRSQGLGVALSRKDDECLFLAVLIALKYPALEMLATSCRAGVPCFLAILEALWNSRWRVVRWGVHQGLE